MSDLVRTLLICGLLSGTQPITLMGLLLVMGGASPRANGWAFIGGAFMIQAGLLLAASALFGGTVSQRSTTGHSFIGLRLVIGIVLVVFGLLLRRPPGKPIPEIPNALQRLQGMGPKQSFVAGIVVADYQGPVIASLALAANDVTFAGRLVGLGCYALVATGVPLGLMLWSTRSARAHARLTQVTTWVMRNRRALASWAAILVGLLLVGDAALTLLTT
jgi:Sap, sulfolipid-1-addressing protein